MKKVSLTLLRMIVNALVSLAFLTGVLTVFLFQDPLIWLTLTTVGSLGSAWFWAKRIKGDWNFALLAFLSTDLIVNLRFTFAAYASHSWPAARDYAGFAAYGHLILSPFILGAVLTTYVLLRLLRPWAAPPYYEEAHSQRRS
jgi:hypothetical protein